MGKVDPGEITRYQVHWKNLINWSQNAILEATFKLPSNKKKGQKQAGGSGIERQGQNSETAQRFKLHDWHLTECGRWGRSPRSISSFKCRSQRKWWCHKQKKKKEKQRQSTALNTLGLTNWCDAHVIIFPVNNWNRFKSLPSPQWNDG